MDYLVASFWMSVSGSWFAVPCGHQWYSQLSELHALHFWNVDRRRQPFDTGSGTFQGMLIR